MNKQLEFHHTLLQKEKRKICAKNSEQISLSTTTLTLSKPSMVMRTLNLLMFVSIRRMRASRWRNRQTWWKNFFHRWNANLGRDSPNRWKRLDSQAVSNSKGKAKGIQGCSGCSSWLDVFVPLSKWWRPYCPGRASAKWHDLTCSRPCLGFLRWHSVWLGRCLQPFVLWTCKGEVHCEDGFLIDNTSPLGQIAIRFQATE